MRKILLKITGKLKVESYSESLFPLDRISIVDDVLQETGSGEWCFSEKRSLRGSEGEIEKLMICRWNRDYPSDVHLDIESKRLAASIYRRIYRQFPRKNNHGGMEV